MHATRTRGRRHGLTFWLWIVFGAVLLVLVTPLAVGLFLSDEYAGSARATIDRPPEVVWEAVSDPRRFPLSAALAREVRMLPGRDGLPAWVEEQRSTTWSVRTLALEPGARVALEVSDGNASLHCEWVIEIAADGAGSRVSIAQRCRVASGRWGGAQLRFIMKFLDGASMAPRSYARRLGEGLGARVELE